MNLFMYTCVYLCVTCIVHDHIEMLISENERVVGPPFVFQDIDGSEHYADSDMEVETEQPESLQDNTEDEPLHQAPMQDEEVTADLPTPKLKMKSISMQTDSLKCHGCGTKIEKDY